MKRVLMIAYHFPPIQGSSGVQRTLRFARDLPDFGWEPVILTAHTRAYNAVSTDQLADIPADLKVVRAQAWDASRHFSIAGRYPGLIARPDRWLSWWLGAVPCGLRLIQGLQPAALWSTYPIATAHLIGATLQSRSKLPWIADFRDPMAQDNYPEDPATWRSYARIEARTLQHAAQSTFTTPSAVDLYRQRYPDRSARISLLENGYDEDSFTQVEAHGPLNPGKFTILHSGIVYPGERDPTYLFEALVRIKSRHPALSARLVVRFRAAVHDALLTDLTTRYELAHAIQIRPPIAYREALAEMCSADALLVLQASNCNAQIPAKLYEYFRARRPIVALTDPTGDTATICRHAGITAIAPLDDPERIADQLIRCCNAPTDGTLPADEAIAKASRRERAQQLAGLLDTATRTQKT